MVREIRDHAKANWPSLLIQVSAILIPTLLAIFLQSFYVARSMGKMEEQLRGLQREVSEAARKDILQTLVDKAAGEHKDINRRITMETEQRIAADNEIRAIAVGQK